MKVALWLLASACLAAPSQAQAQAPRAEVFVQLGHRAAVSALAVSPDGQRLASAGLDGVVKLWEVASGRVAATLQGHSGAVLCIAYSPDGALLATGGRDRTVRLWDARSGAELGAYRGHDSLVLAVAFVSGGKQLVSSSYDRGIRLWSVGNPAQSVEIGRHSEPVRALDVSADGRLLASGSEDRSVRLWNLGDRAAAGELRAESGVLSVRLSPDNTQVAAGLQDGTIRIWGLNKEKNSAPRVLRGHGGAVNALAFSADGRLLASASADATLRLWDVQGGGELASRGAGSEQSAVAFVPRGTRSLRVSPAAMVASGGGDRVVHLWSVPEAAPREQLRSRIAEVRTLDFSPDGAELAVAGADDAVRIWDAARGQVSRSLEGHSQPVEAVRFSRDGALLATAGQDGALRLWDRASGREIAKLDAGKGALFAAAIAPGGATLASGGRDSIVRIWSAARRAVVRELAGHGAAVRDLDFSPDGRLLASCANDDTVRVWEAASGRELLVLKGHANRVNAVRFTPDGTRLVSASEDSTVRVWDARSGAQLALLAGHKGPVKAIAVSATQVMSVSVDETLAAWDLASAKLAYRLPMKAGQLNAVAASPRGFVASAGDGGSTVLTDARDGAERVRLFGFTDREWLSIVPAGHFHASPDGARYLNVRVGDEVYGLDQFLETFLRPDLVSVALGNVQSSEEQQKQRLERESAQREQLARIERDKFERERTEAARREAEARLAQRLEEEKKAREELARIQRERIEFERVEALARMQREKIELEKSAALRREAEENAKLTAQKPPPRARELAEIKPAPDVAIIGLPAEVVTGEVNVRLRISDKGGGVGDVRIYLNGSAVIQDRSSQRAAGPGERDYLVRLVEGRNQVRAVAFNADNNMQSADSTHELLARLPAQRKPSLHALVIGIQEFANPRLKLSFSVADANLLAGVLEGRSRTLFDKVEVRRLLTPAQTTRSAIAQALREVRERIAPEDLFVFYVASHGTVDEGEYFLFTSNVGSTSTERLRGDALGERDLRDMLANIPATKKLILFDTCNAGRIGDVLVATRGMAEDRATKVLSRAVGSTVITAATSLQEALEGYKGHGLFTYVVAQALGGKADYDRDGFVGTSELALYVENEVPELAETVFNFKQFPLVSRPPSSMAFPVTRIAP